MKRTAEGDKMEKKIKILAVVGSTASGKSALAIELAKRLHGEIVSCDLHPHRVELIRKNAERMGVGIISGETRDASLCDEALFDEFDLVICDVPCSGLGVIGKKPDLRYKDPDDFEALQQLQKKQKLFVFLQQHL